MPRITHVAWWCGMCRTKNDYTQNMCVSCGNRRFEKCAQVHASERAVVYYNPATGEHRTPPRADMPMPDQYAAAGFERREIMNMGSWERESGTVHEATNFNPGNEETPLDPRDTVAVPPESKESLIEDMRAAFASGPWTGGL